MANTLVLLERVTVGAAGASSVTFSNIPQTGYNDLIIKVSARDNTASNGKDYIIQFNGVTTSYNYRRIYGDSSTVYSDSASTGQSLTIGSANSTASTFANCEVYIPNYTSANYKSWSADTVFENNASGASSTYPNLYSCLWSNTAAITSIAIKPASGSPTIVQYSTFSLYGVSNVNTTPTVAPKATGGDIIQTDGTYWYHAFINSGSFTPATALSCDLLVIAGGGGGGWQQAGGGGAGGLLAFTSQSLASSTAQTVTIGAGGTGSSSGSRGTNGNDSIFGSLTTAIGGGGGGSYNGTTSGASGGSGGGGATTTAGGASGGSGTSGQGYAGGSGNSDGTTYRSGGGGGGAGGLGGNYTTLGATGGAGVSTYSSWASATSTGVSGAYAGGGAGGGNTGGSATAGGGAAGGTTQTTAGTANTGGGGGGGGYSSSINGGNGGSGIVIVRYTVA